MASIRHKAFSGSIHISVLPSFPERPLHLHFVTLFFSLCFCFFSHYYPVNNHYNLYPEIWFDMWDKQILMLNVCKKNVSYLKNKCLKSDHIISFPLNQYASVQSGMINVIMFQFSFPGTRYVWKKTRGRVCGIQRVTLYFFHCEKHNKGRFSCNCERAPSSFVVKGDITHNSTLTTMFFYQMFLCDTARAVHITALYAKKHLTMKNINKSKLLNISFKM